MTALRETADSPTTAQIAADSVRMTPVRGVLGSAMVVSFATLLSRVAGLARDVLTAMLFGFGREIDAFFLAFTVPNLFRKLFGEGALSSAMIPVLTRYKLRGDMEATRRLLGTMASLLVGSSRVDLQACKLEYSIVSPK